MVHVPRHPAYTDPSCPTNVLRAYMLDPKASENWADPAIITEVLYEVVSRGQKIPIRLPLGMDSWGMIKGEVEKIGKELEELKGLSTRSSGEAQLGSIEFLMK